MLKRPLQRSSAHGTEVSRSYAAGELICREGETSLEMFVVQRGSVRIFKTVRAGERANAVPPPAVVAGPIAAELDLAVLRKGDFFGEMSLLEGLPRDASAQAVEPAEVLVMTPGALLVRLRRDPTFAFELLRRSSSRVRALNARLMALLAERGSEPALASRGVSPSEGVSSEAVSSEAVSPSEGLLYSAGLAAGTRGGRNGAP